jgi:hypothetical protein
MDAQQIIADLKQKLSEVQLPEGFNLDTATSKEFVDYVAPLLIPLIAYFGQYIEGKIPDKDKAVMDFLGPFVPPEEGVDAKTKQEGFEVAGLAPWEEAKAIYDFINTTQPFKYILRVLKAGMWFYTTIFAQMQASQETSKQSIYADERPSMLDINTLVDMHFKQPDLQLVVREELAKYGLKEVDITRFLHNLNSVYPEQMVRNLFFRNEWDDSKLLQYTRNFRIPDADIKDWKQFWTVFPTMQELILFAVRECYETPLDQEGPLDLDRPGIFDSEAKKAGADKHYAKLAWRAHWQLPSLLRGYEMFHRKVITSKEELKGLMKALDIAPHWREKLIDISYKLMTRVDLRRVYKAGFIEPEELPGHYESQGYDPTTASLLAGWTEVNENPYDKELTLSMILDLYDHREYGEPETLQMLEAIGYKPEIADDVLKRHKFKKQDSINKRRLTYIKKGYINNIFSESEAIQKITALGYKEQFAWDELTDYKVDKALKDLRLTTQQLQKIYTENIWDYEKVNNYLAGKGYTPDDRHALLTLWDLEKE